MEQVRKSSSIDKQRLEQAEEYRRLHGRIQPVGAGAYAIESGSLHRQHELQRTLPFAKRGPAINEPGRQVDTKLMTPWVMAAPLSTSNDPQGTLNTIETTKQTAQAASDWFSRLAKLFEGQIHLRSGDLDKAMKLARELVDFDAPVDIELSIFYPLCIEVLIANKECDKALQIVDQILVWLKDSGSRYKTNMLVLRAWACQSKGNEEEAISTLEAALQYAETKHDLFPFINSSQYIEQVLEKTKAKDLIKDLLARIFAIERITTAGQQIGANLHTHQEVESLIEPLTERESEILRLLNSHLPTPEIADMLALSVNTVRTHIKSVYAKLGVHTRTTAIEVSRKLKLLA